MLYVMQALLWREISCHTKSKSPFMIYSMQSSAAIAKMPRHCRELHDSHAQLVEARAIAKAEQWQHYM